MRALFEGIDLAAANTSMTINATAMWLLALYATVAREQGARGKAHRHHAKRHHQVVPVPGTYIFPPGPSVRPGRPTSIAWAVEHCPQWNPVNICSYHLQEAGATPVQEVGFALATAVAVLDRVRETALRWGPWSSGSRSSSTPGCAS
jgi:(2R)-ethylmalonyl-CoA mutase